jgi:tetratricopeptide (TPR) repeat protein
MAVPSLHVAGRVLALFLIQVPAVGLPVPAPGGPEDPRIRAVVEQFFAAQESEDVDAYMALWSAKARKPRPEQLAFVFNAGDDRFLDLVIDRVTEIGDLRRVTVSVTRERTASAPDPDGTRRVVTARRAWSLTLVIEGEEVKILSEGFPADDLAAALVAAPSAEAREAMMAAEPEALTDRLISAIAARADAFAATQQYAAARSVYERVLEVARRIENRRAEGEALQNIGNSYYFQNNYPSALDSYEQRLALERTTDNAEGAAAAMQGIATVKYSTFHYGDALDAYREALALFTALKDDAGMATALLSSGNVLYLQGDLGGAIDAYRRSRALYKAGHNTDGEARALDGLGRVYVSQGDYAGALDAFAGVWEEGRARGNRIMQANARHSTGEVHLRLGNADAARGI